MREIQISEIKARQLDMLKAVDEICKKNNLRYSLAGGTLLGAIRHKGYIPWDDDVDIMMPRTDYEKLKSIKMPDGYSFITPYSKSNKPYIYTYGKIYDEKTKLIELPDSKRIESHIYMDVFPIDAIPEDYDEYLCLFKRIRRYMTVNHVLERSYYNKKDKTKQLPQRFLWSVCWFVRQICPKRFLVKKAEKILMKKTFDESFRVGCMVAGYGTQENYLKSSFELTTGEFEGLECSIIKGYDEYLKALYNDYMQLPPEEKRVAAHDYIAYITE